MTRDEVLEQAAKALEDDGASERESRVVRALKSKPPEKSPEVEGMLRRLADAARALCDAVAADYSADHHRDDCPGDCEEHAVGDLLNKAWDLAQDAVAIPPQRDVITDIDRLVDEQNALRRQRDFAQSVNRRYLAEIDGLVAERDELRLLHKTAADAVAELSEKLATQERRAAEAVAPPTSGRWFWIRSLGAGLLASRACDSGGGSSASSATPSTPHWPANGCAPRPRA